jgi:hypothetical protein
VQAFLFRGVHVCELDAKVLTSRPSHSGPTYMDGLLMCRNVHTERDRCTNLYKCSAFNATSAPG